MLLAVVTHTSQTWVDLTHVASLLGAFSASLAVGLNLRNRGKLNQIHINTNGNLTAVTAALQEATKELAEVRSERDVARAVIANAVVPPPTKQESP